MDETTLPQWMGDFNDRRQLDIPMEQIKSFSGLYM